MYKQKSAECLWPSGGTVQSQHTNLFTLFSFRSSFSSTSLKTISILIWLLIYIMTKLIHGFSLVDRCVKTRVCTCKHVCDVKELRIFWEEFYNKIVKRIFSVFISSSYPHLDTWGVRRILDCIWSLHNCQFSQPPLCLDEIMQT